MTRFSRIRRRPDHWSSPHERARVRAAERLDGPLGLAEATWLDEHLAGCPACTAAAASYDADRETLRSMRGTAPEPPRDLWARTSAAIEQESSKRGRRPATSGRRVPLGALSGLAVIAVVVGVSTVSNGLFLGSTPSPDAATAPNGSPELDSALGEADGGGLVEAAAEATPIAVGAGGVAWVQSQADGTFAYNTSAIDEVCPNEAKEDCATIGDAASRRLSIDTAPETIIATPARDQAVAVTRDATGGQSLVIVDLPETTGDGVAASPSPEAGETPAVGASASPPPASDAPLASPSAETSLDPLETAAPTSVPLESAPVASAPPEVAVAPSEEPLPDPTPSPTPEATLAAVRSLASDVEIIESSAAFSPDGEWFAYTAQPSDGSRGPDVYVWRVGDAETQRLTNDGNSTFASWSGDQVVVSRSTELEPSASSEGGAGDTSAGQDGTPTSLVIDPTTGSATVIDDTWRPAVDPTERWAVTFVGSLAADGCDGCWKPNTGQLEVRPWSPTGEAGGSTGTVLADTGGDFDVRWDGSGEWFAVWIADPNYGTFGRLSLYRIDPATGEIDQPDGSPIDVLSLPGFSIGQGRLAWATPPGQGGEGSRVQVVAWTKDGVGAVETVPGDELVVVR